MATILSAQCTDERVNKVTPGLFQKYPTPQDFAALPQPVLEEEIRSTGFFRNKAKNIIGTAKKLVADFGGQVPRTMEEMLTLPGVARKTANVVLGTAYGIPTGVVVDTHVFRIAHRLKLSRQKTPEKVEQDLMKLVPRERWISFGHQVIWFGRKICQARKPLCAECPLEDVLRLAGEDDVSLGDDIFAAIHTDDITRDPMGAVVHQGDDGGGHVSASSAALPGSACGQTRPAYRFPGSCSNRGNGHARLDGVGGDAVRHQFVGQLADVGLEDRLGR